jgi:uncharacterized protein
VLLYALSQSLMRRLLAGAALAAFALVALAADVSEPIAVPKLTGRVVDLTGTLTAAESDDIAGRLKAFEQAKGAQVAVLIVPSIGPEPIEDFALRVTDSWKLGRAGVDDGVLFVIAKQERKMRIQTGRGVQGVLTDALSKRIIAERVSPRFRTGDFHGGILVGVESIMKAIEGEALPPPAKNAGKKVDVVSSFENFFWLAFFVVPVVGMILRSLVGRFLGAALTSGATGLAAWLLFGSLFFGVVATLIAFVLVLFAGTPGTGARPGGGWTSGGWSHGGGGSWSGGGGDSFSGGGGGFDGGGASGDW